MDTGLPQNELVLGASDRRGWARDNRFISSLQEKPLWSATPIHQCIIIICQINCIRTYHVRFSKFKSSTSSISISWTEKITNEEVLRRMGTGREIVRQFKTRNIQYLEHLIRHNSTQLQLIEGKIEGRRSRGRPRNIWTTDITTTKGLKYYQLKRAAEDRKRWHGLVVNLAQETTLR